jgi:hypothetical protein
MLPAALDALIDWRVGLDQKSSISPIVDSGLWCHPRPVLPP